jgi:hypothetical protein
MDSSLKIEAKNFFHDLRLYYMLLLADYPERIKIRLWHRLLGTQPRGAIYVEIAMDCDLAIEALRKQKFNIVVEILDELIEWYEADSEHFPNSVVEKRTSAEVKAVMDTMLDLRKKLMELK